MGRTNSFHHLTWAKFYSSFIYMPTNHVQLVFKLYLRVIWSCINTDLTAGHSKQFMLTLYIIALNNEKNAYVRGNCETTIKISHALLMEEGTPARVRSYHGQF